MKSKSPTAKTATVRLGGSSLRHLFSQDQRQRNTTTQRRTTKSIISRNLAPKQRNEVEHAVVCVAVSSWGTHRDSAMLKCKQTGMSNYRSDHPSFCIINRSGGLQKELVLITGDKRFFLWKLRVNLKSEVTLSFPPSFFFPLFLHLIHHLNIWSIGVKDSR